MFKSYRFKFVAVAVLVGLGAFAYAAYAIHSWGSYHWAHISNPFTLKLGDNVSTVWDGHLSIASTDWSVSTVLDTNIVAGLSNPKNCKPVSGRVEVCNSKYGNNGWLGLAQIWVSDSHITKGAVKLNDTYFNTAKYNTPAWRNLVMCQEVGHMFGLDHQNEIFDNPNLGTCMDYTANPAGPPSNEHPNQHDYDILEKIYAHFDTTTIINQTLSNGNGNNGRIDADLGVPAEWGKEIRKSSDGKNSIFERDLGKGQKIFTFVIWVN